MASGDRADGVGHRQHGEAKREGDAHEAYSQAWKRCCQHGAPAASEDQPKCSKELSSCTLCNRHISSRENCQHSLTMHHETRAPRPVQSKYKPSLLHVSLRVAGAALGSKRSPPLSVCVQKRFLSLDGLLLGGILTSKS